MDVSHRFQKLNYVFIMPSRTTGLRHYQKHKKNTTNYPILDKLIYFAAVFSPAMTVPQIWKIWESQDAAGVSAITWISYIVVSVIWLTYGLAHKEKVICLTNILWILLGIPVVIGAIIFG